MNIFFLDPNPKIAAQYHNNKHTVKMILEYAQILSTTHHLMGNPFQGEILYKPTHPNHPSTIWARASRDNYIWLCELALELCYEYTYRYHKVHKSQAIIEWAYSHIPPFKLKDITMGPKVMPEHCMVDDLIMSYRRYYLVEKKDIAQWGKRGAPHWWH